MLHLLADFLVSSENLYPPPPFVAHSFRSSRADGEGPVASGDARESTDPSASTRLRMTPITTLSRADARRMLVSHLGLARPLRSVREVLTRLRCIQLDPLDVIGTNADLVVMARVDGAKRGDVWRKLFPRHAFEHFFKVRCILPAASFPQYR